MEREHLAVSDSYSHFSFCRQKGKHLWQRNMPNVRIAFMTSQFGCELSTESDRPESDGPALRLESAMTDNSSQRETTAPVPERKPLSPAAQRALAEAEARRQAAAADAKSMPREFQGPKGPEPTRYGDWETKGIASDF
jgi:hypothetical protein